MKSLHELFIDGVKDIYSAEKQLVKALPKMAKMAQNPRLKEGFQNHLRQTEEHARRVEQACQTLGEKPTGMVCRGMMGLIEEATEHMGELKPSACADAELIALAQKVEHYEIGSYGTLCTWAQLMGHNEALELFKQNLNEEEQTDQLLTQLAESEVNRMAAEESQQMQMEQQESGGRGRSGGGRGRSSTATGRGRTSTGTGRGRSTTGTGRGRASTGGRSSTGRSSTTKSSGTGRGSGGRTSTAKSSGGRSTSGRSSTAKSSGGRSTSGRSSGGGSHSKTGSGSRGGSSRSKTSSSGRGKSKSSR